MRAVNALRTRPRQEFHQTRSFKAWLQRSNDGAPRLFVTDSVILAPKICINDVRLDLRHEHCHDSNVSILNSLFSKSTAAPAPAVADAFSSSVGFKIPPLLPKLAQSAGAAPGGGPGDASAQLTSLLKEQKAPEAIDLLAKKLPEHDAVRWASESCDAVSEKLTPTDTAALESCKAWLADPSVAKKDLAAAAAAKAGHGGPGAWAAQAAAWSQMVGSPPASSNISGSLIAKAVAGSVMLAAALSKPGITLPATGEAVQPPTGRVPEIGTTAPAMNLRGAAAPSAVAPSAEIPRDELCRMYKPFIDKGIAIAAGG